MREIGEDRSGEIRIEILNEYLFVNCTSEFCLRDRNENGQKERLFSGNYIRIKKKKKRNQIKMRKQRKNSKVVIFG